AAGSSSDIAGKRIDRLDRNLGAADLDIGYAGSRIGRRGKRRSVVEIVGVRLIGEPAGANFDCLRRSIDCNGAEFLARRSTERPGAKSGPTIPSIDARPLPRKPRRGSRATLGVGGAATRQGIHMKIDEASRNLAIAEGRIGKNRGEEGFV